MNMWTTKLDTEIDDHSLQCTVGWLRRHFKVDAKPFLVSFFRSVRCGRVASTFILDGCIICMRCYEARSSSVSQFYQNSRAANLAK